MSGYSFNSEEEYNEYMSASAEAEMEQYAMQCEEESKQQFIEEVCSTCTELCKDLKCFYNNSASRKAD